MQYNQKRAIKSSKRAQVWIFTPHFLFTKLHSPKQHVFLQFLVEKKTFNFSKRALRAGAARNKLLKSPVFEKSNNKKSLTIRIQSDDSIMCRFYCIAFIEYTLAGEPLLDCTNLFSPYKYKKNGKTIYRFFKDKCCKRRSKPWI